MANPMSKPGIKAKMIRSRRKRGDWRPPVRGGNGQGPTVPQQLLFDALGQGWVMELAVRTGTQPHHYKLDLALLAKRVAVEVDGETHKTLQGREQDARKDRVLTGLGWTVLRFSNRAILKNVNACVQEVWSITSMLKARKPTS